MIMSFVALLVLASSVVYAKASNEINLSFKGNSGTVLGGTLVYPAHSFSLKSFPAVLLLPGSGPTDRNDNQPPVIKTDLLKQIAEALALQGIASFRFDKRAAHVNKMQWPVDEKNMSAFFSWENHKSDVETAFLAMKSAKEIDRPYCLKNS